MRNWMDRKLHDCKPRFNGVDLQIEGKDNLLMQ